ncbi:peroxide stress protein YaaA [Roseovarius phycicola]|uniref:UPF0246 protein RZ517_00230 n=1 Tax=Roseovarius phycicola TaxID=3080976 RepID=A0ABZ2HIJ7_9RHOB
MLIVVSPAKKLDMDRVEGAPRTEPDFMGDTETLVQTARKLKSGDLKKLMGISDTLAALNAERFRDFGKMSRKQAAYAFAGDTYQGLEAASLDQDEIAWAQDHLRILSGLYGLLRPLDEIEPYRLEMGSRLKTKRGKSLYEFWGDTLSRALNIQADAVGTDFLVNCASQEYFGAVDQNALKLKVITPVFMEVKDGAPKVISFFAKRARGAMARFIIQNRLTEPDALKDFDTGGYAFDPSASTEGRPVFLRDYATD